MNDAMEPGTLTVAIRPMTAADLPLVADLEQRIFSDPWPPESFAELLADAQWSALVAESDSGIVGYACVMTAPPHARLTNIAVVEEQRRKSVAQQLLDHILEIVTGDLCELILLEVRPSNEAAIRFYRKHGFRELFRRPGYYQQPPEDALIMVRYLTTD